MAPETKQPIPITPEQLAQAADGQRAVQNVIAQLDAAGADILAPIANAVASAMSAGEQTQKQIMGRLQRVVAGKSSTARRNGSTIAHALTTPVQATMDTLAPMSAQLYESVPEYSYHPGGPPLNPTVAGTAMNAGASVPGANAGASVSGSSAASAVGSRSGPSLRQPAQLANQSSTQPQPAIMKCGISEPLAPVDGTYPVQLFDCATNNIQGPIFCMQLAKGQSPSDIAPVAGMYYGVDVSNPNCGQTTPPPPITPAPPPSTQCPDGYYPNPDPATAPLQPCLPNFTVTPLPTSPPPPPPPPLPTQPPLPRSILPAQSTCAPQLDPAPDGCDPCMVWAVRQLTNVLCNLAAQLCACLCGDCTPSARVNPPVVEWIPPPVPEPDYEDEPGDLYRPIEPQVPHFPSAPPFPGSGPVDSIFPAEVQQSLDAFSQAPPVGGIETGGFNPGMFGQ